MAEALPVTAIDELGISRSLAEDVGLQLADASQTLHGHNRQQAPVFYRVS
jgi:hypothetical protein